MNPSLLVKFDSVIKSIHNKDNCNEFLYPLFGILIDDGTKVGKVSFLNKNKLHGFSSIDSLFLNDIFAKIAITEQCKDGRNSLALKYIKETIGYFYILKYCNSKYVMDECKILITNKKHYDMDEGLIPYYSIVNDSSLLKNAQFANPGLNFDYNQFSSNNRKSILEIIEKNEEDRNEIEKKIAKSLEFLYYIINDPNANNRMTNYFILLNHLFRDHENDININGINQYINYYFTKLKPMEFVTGKKNTQVLSDLYDRLRNNIQHGIIVSELESSIIDEHDMISLKKIIMETIIILAEHPELNKHKNMKDVFNDMKAKQKERI